MSRVKDAFLDSGLVQATQQLGGSEKSRNGCGTILFLILALFIISACCGLLG